MKFFILVLIHLLGLTSLAQSQSESSCARIGCDLCGSARMQRVCPVYCRQTCNFQQDEVKPMSFFQLESPDREPPTTPIPTTTIPADKIKYYISSQLYDLLPEDVKIRYSTFPPTTTPSSTTTTPLAVTFTSPTTLSDTKPETDNEILILLNENGETEKPAETAENGLIGLFDPEFRKQFIRKSDQSSGIGYPKDTNDKLKTDKTLDGQPDVSDYYDDDVSTEPKAAGTGSSNFLLIDGLLGENNEASPFWGYGVTTTPAPLRCPNVLFRPCVAPESANRRYHQCCQLYAPGCENICHYNMTHLELNQAVITGVCPINHLQAVLRCAAGNNDVTPCCNRAGVFSFGRGFCQPFCHPANGLPVSANTAYRRCLDQLPTIHSCYLAYQNTDSTIFQRF